MPTVYLPLGSKLASGTIGQLITFEGVKCRQCVVPYDPRTDGQLAVRNLFHDVTRTYRTLGPWMRMLYAGILGPRWFTLLHKRAAENGGARFAEKLVEFDGFSVGDKNAWDAAAPFAVTYARPGAVFWACYRIALEYQEAVSPGAIGFDDDLPWAVGEIITEWNWDLSAALGVGQWDDTSSLMNASSTWHRVNDEGAFGGSYLQQSGGSRGAIIFNVVCKQLSVYYLKQPGGGTMLVEVDGNLVGSVDQNASVLTYGAVWTSPEMFYGAHEVIVEQTNAYPVTFDGINAMGKGRPKKVSATETGLPAIGTYVQTEVDFGSGWNYWGQFTIDIADVQLNDKVIVTQAGDAATGRQSDENEMEPILFSALATSGSILIYASALDGPVYGKFKVNVVYG